VPACEKTGSCHCLLCVYTENFIYSYENPQNRCHQSCSFWPRYASNRLSAAWSFAPDPTGRAYSAPQGPIAGLGVAPPPGGGEGRGNGRGRERKGGGGRGNGKGEEGMRAERGSCMDTLIFSDELTPFHVTLKS